MRHGALAIAMTEWRPFWDGMPDDRRKASIAEIDEAMALHPKTDREQRFIAGLGNYGLFVSKMEAEQVRAAIDELPIESPIGHHNKYISFGHYGLGVIDLDVIDPASSL
jgi:hypothetical protein